SEAGRFRSFDISDWYSFSLIGGFKGGESQVDQANPSSHITILSGDLNQDGLPEGNAYNVVTAKDNVTVTISGIVIEHGNAIYHTDDIPGVATSQVTNLQRARTEAALASMIVGGQPQGYDTSWVEIRVHSDEGLTSGGTKWDNGNDDRDPWTPFGGWKETDLPWLKKLSDGSGSRAARWAFNKELYISSNPISDDVFEFGYKSQPSLTPFFPGDIEYGNPYSSSEKVFPYNVVPLLEEGMPGPRALAPNRDLLYPRGVQSTFGILFQKILGLNQAYYDAFHRRGNGGGVRSFRCGKLLFQNCVFRKNSADLYGGAVFSKHSAVRYESCHAFDNVAFAAGGALCHFEDTFRALNCDFVNNSSGEGGGIYTIWEGDDYKSSSQSGLELAIEQVEGKAKGAFKNHEQKFLSGATRGSIRDMAVLAAGNRLEEGVNQLVLRSYNPGFIKTQMIIAAYSGFKYFNDWLERKGCDGDKTCVAFSRFMMDVTDSIDLVLRYTDISNYFAQLVEITSEPAVLHGDNILGIFGNSEKVSEEARDAAELEEYFREQAALEKALAERRKAYNSEARSWLSDCLFFQNRSNLGGSAIRAIHTNIKLTRTEFSENASIGSDLFGGTFGNDQEMGGAVNGSHYSDIFLDNCLFKRNTTKAGVASAIVFRQNVNSFIRFCTFHENHCQNEFGSAVFGSNAVIARVENSVFWGNTATEEDEVSVIEARDLQSV
ncbi:MAG: hypothetical protein HOI66_15210, partial [Verrucomicrobia bacterium]|nr:hypothetical protein [Verrucomicrobiota bacterium]